MWRLIDSWYSNAYSSVRINGYGIMSRPFKINKGVRQGGVLSTTMYKSYINDLLKILEDQNVGVSIGNSYLGAPTCADDIILAADNSYDLQTMLKVVEAYASRGRYIIHPSKRTALVYYSKTPNEILQESDPWSMNGKSLQISSKCTHLDMIRSTESRSAEKVESRILLARRSTYALIGAWLHGYNGVNPCLSAKLLSTYIYPRYLFGLETVNLRQEEVTKLNKHGKKVLLKSIQHLPDRTADEAVYYLLGEIPIQARIDRQGLILLAGIVRNEGIEKDLAIRQLSIKKRNSNSWFVRVDQTLSKYGLRSAVDITTGRSLED